MTADTALAASDSDAGSPVVMLPGAAADRGLFMQSGLWQHVADRGLRAIAVDWRGTGESAARPPEYSIEDEAADVIAMMDAKGIDVTQIVGVSHGSAAALHLALAHPDRVSSLVLCSPWAVTTPSMRHVLDTWTVLFEHASMQQIGESMVWWIFSQEFIDADAQRARDMAGLMFAAPGSADRESHLNTNRQNLVYDVRDRLGEISVPVFVLAGESDKTIPAACSQDVAERIPGAQFQLLSGTGSSHAFLAEMGEPVITTVGDFLRRNA